MSTKLLTISGAVAEIEMAVVLAVGDVGAKRSDPATMFTPVANLLRGGDITFGQLETVITDRGAMSPAAKLAMRANPGLAPALAAAGFDVMSFAGNHCLDWGFEGFADTLSAVAGTGMKLCGAGPNLTQARRPALIESSGLTVAFLAYNSILPEGYAADNQRPGCVPLRAHTIYQQIEPDQPGTGARTLSFPDPRDIEAMVSDIEKARGSADLVFVSMHWGLHMTEAVIADYQRAAARAAIDAGACAIIGHHAHILKGIEIYRGAPIFYSLGNFAIEQPHVWDPEIVQTSSFRHLASLNPGFDVTAFYMLPPQTRMTGIARIVCNKGGLVEVGFIPAYIRDDSVPEIVSPESARFGEIATYLETCSRSAGFGTKFTLKGSYLMIS
jgi:poly-gamma-glutamate capsule biosynthesis protein CapA/YwtB (metallophosphatase superfamily)